MRPEQEAPFWFARMRAADSERSRIAFAEWYAEPENAEAYDRHARSWEKTKFLANTDIGRARSLDRARLSNAHGPAWRLVASVIVALIFVPMLLWGIKARQTAEHVITRTEVATIDEAPRQVLLPDGSQVLLDRGAELKVEYDGRERRMRLVKGRARFTVAHDRAHKFIVQAGAGRVIAHGTQFDVSVEGVSVQVALLEGAVEVRAAERLHGQGRVDLAAGQGVNLAGSVLSRPHSLAATTPQWTTDMLELDGVPLKRAIELFNRTSRVKVRIDVGEVGLRQVSGAFRRGDADSFSRQIAKTFGLQVQAEAGGDLMLRTQ